MSGCEYCHRSSSHDSRCPNYIYPKTELHCANCGGGIYEGEEYIENDNGEYSHYDCFLNLRDLAEWLGYKVKTMDIDD